MSYAEVAVDAPTPSRGTFTYRIPSYLDLAPGHSVWVPFGPRTMQGIVMEVTSVPSVAPEKVRDVRALQDPAPLLSPVQLDVVRWMAREYLTPLFQAALIFLPPAFRRPETTYVRLTDEGREEDMSSLSHTKREVVQYLREHGPVAVATLRHHLGSGGVRALTLLEREGVAQREVRSGRRRVGPRLARFLVTDLDGPALEEALGELQGQGALRQEDLLAFLGREGRAISQAEALRRTGTSASVVGPLEKRGFIRVTERRVRRDPLADIDYAPAAPLTPSPDQQRALATIITALREKSQEGEERVFLLHGVTGSGKTEVYLQALAEAVRQGKQGLVLVPEIALTPQTIQRFWERFPGRVAVLHSQLSPGERYDEWWGAREGMFDVVIGPRSAVGAPLARLGLIVIDEEHEPAYKQNEPAPRYQTRDVARELARRSDAVLVLGSATPDVESYYGAQRGELRLLELSERIAAAEGTGYRVQPRPDVQIVDMREELKAGNTSIFSRSLASALEQTLAAREQAILFLNRRGTSTSVQCRDCGYIAQCPRCSVPLTFHAPSTLSCHQCNRRVALLSRCPECGSSRIRYLGVGTERVVEEVAKAFPAARVLRWDRDTTQGRGAHEEILGALLRHDADILVGTQMLAKGLHMPLVSLVGVVNADVGLHMPDFRAGERTYQLLSQVAGRAGRGLTPGRAIVQTYSPSHYAIQAVARQSYEEFYREESAFRRALGYPPFNRIVRLVYAHTSFRAAQREAVRLYEALRGEIAIRGLPDLQLVGPAPAYLQRLRGRYRWHLLVKGPDPLSLLAETFLPEGWVVDVDPVNLL